MGPSKRNGRVARARIPIPNTSRCSIGGAAAAGGGGAGGRCIRAGLAVCQGHCAAACKGELALPASVGRALPRRASPGPAARVKLGGGLLGVHVPSALRLRASEQHARVALAYREREVGGWEWDPATSVQRVTASGGPSSVLEAARLCSFQIKTS